jgi:Leucine-rich repeat (LRR) protein
MYRLTICFGVILILQSNECSCTSPTTDSVIKRVRRKTLTIPQLLGRDVTLHGNANANRNYWEEFGSAVVKKGTTHSTEKGEPFKKIATQSDATARSYAIKRIDSLEEDLFERLLGFGGSLSLSISMSMPTGPTVPQPSPTIPILPTSIPNPGSTCQSNPACAALALTGACCPTIDNVFLDCCSSIPVSSPVLPPATAPTSVTKPPLPGKDTKTKKTKESPNATMAPATGKDTKTKLPKGPTTETVPPATSKDTKTKSPKGSITKTVAPTNSSPIASPLITPTIPTQPKEPVQSPVVSPSTGSTPVQVPSSISSSCSANSVCASLGLSGACCPTPAGIFLDCCQSIPVVPDATMQPTVVGDLTSPVDSDSGSLSDPPSGISFSSMSPSGSKFEQTGVDRTSTPPSGISLSTMSPSGSTFEQTGGDRKTTILEKCGVTELERSDALISMLRNISGTSSLTDSASAPFKALYWVDQLDEALVCTSDSSAVKQRYSLAVMYFSLNGPGWNESSLWLGTGTECKWYGVTCDSADTITGIVLKENNLTGTLPQELFELTSLTGLSLDHNGISGTIPDAIGSLTGLQQLELDDNELVGKIPSSIYQISGLKALDLNSNSLIGEISDAIGNFADLMVLQVENNKLTGAIPWYGLASLDKLRKLQCVMVFDDNTWYPNISFSFTVVLYLHGNNFGPDNSLEPVCTRVASRRVDYPGFLQYFSASCDVICTCCTECF